MCRAAYNLVVERCDEVLTKVWISYLPQQNPMESKVLKLLSIRDELNCCTQHAIDCLQLKVREWIEDCKVTIANNIKHHVTFVLHDVAENLLDLDVLKYFNLIKVSLATFFQNLEHLFSVIQALDLA